LKQVFVESARYVESDTALLQRVFGRDIGGKKNISVLNDEANHAYRIAEEVPDGDDLEFGNEDDADDELLGDKKEATVWVEGLDRIQRMRGYQLLCRSIGYTLLRWPGWSGDEQAVSVGGERLRPYRRH
jgi:type III restriction enzyme